MKLFNQFTILKKNERDLDYAKKNMANYWTRECEEHPTNQHCLVYCDQQIIPTLSCWKYIRYKLSKDLSFS